MIKVYFPPGCYGTYFTKCLYNYTNLRNEPFVDFDFDQHGSSHQHRSNSHAQLVIKCGHIGTLASDTNDKLVSILPVCDNMLDYYNNQFFKQGHGALIDYILSQLSLDSAKNKLKDQWGYIGEFDEQVPQWILREWCSFWINDVLQQSYNGILYQNLQSEFHLTTKDIFENLPKILAQAADVLGLSITVDTNTINCQHQKFLQVQKFHNSQKRCQHYVHSLLADINETMTLHSIFDEAYIQQLLRQQKLELQCDGLDKFPTTTQHLKALTYETSDHCNS
jgi:hypothetical protein